MSILKSLLDRLRKTVSRQARELQHPYFGRMLYFVPRDPRLACWEAELTIGEPPGRIGVTLDGTPEGPTQAEEAFCREIVADLDALFERCRTAFAPHFEEWTESPMPENWREAVEVDGFTVPKGGDPAGEWELCYFVRQANHWFTAVFVEGTRSGGPGRRLGELVHGAELGVERVQLHALRKPR